MLEIVLLMAALLLTPKGIWLPVVCITAILLCIPGAYATWFGAPFLPTSHPILARMISMARLQKGEIAYDLGCGDGRVLLAASTTGAKVTGYELSILMYVYCKLRCLFQRDIRVKLGNFWTKDFRDADVIFCYLLTDTMKTFKAKIWPQLKPGCRVVSHAFRMEGIEPDEVAEKVVVYVKKAA